MEPSSPSSARARAPRAALAALSCLALGACRVLDATVYNLGELHGGDGRHRYSGALEGSVEYLIRHELAPLFPHSRLAKPKAPEPIEDPCGECFERMIRLGGYDARSPRVAARQVEWFARLAVEDPALLSRERALIELGRAAERLEVGPEALAADAVPAGPEALSEALSSLARTVEHVQRGSGSRQSRELDFEAAVRVVEDLVLDLDGARRALLVASELLDKGGLRGEAEPLERLQLHLERVCVRRALATALSDPVPRVRAAALEAAVRAHGTAVLAPVLVRLSQEPPELAASVLRLVEEHGLPPPDPEQGERRYLASMMRQLERGTQGEVRVRAMAALSRVSGAGIESLREEVWQAWWESAAPAGAPAADERAPGADPRGSGVL